MADGDGRTLLNMAEQVLSLAPDAPPLDAAGLAGLLSRRAALYDRDRDEHFNLISALHKSIRGSDPDAALYWFARMTVGGEDLRTVATFPYPPYAVVSAPPLSQLAHQLLSLLIPSSSLLLWF